MCPFEHNSVTATFFNILIILWYIFVYCYTYRFVFFELHVVISRNIYLPMIGPAIIHATLYADKRIPSMYSGAPNLVCIYNHNVGSTTAENNVEYIYIYIYSNLHIHYNQKDDCSPVWNTRTSMQPIQYCSYIIYCYNSKKERAQLGSYNR